MSEPDHSMSIAHFPFVGNRVPARRPAVGLAKKVGESPALRILTR